MSIIFGYKMSMEIVLAVFIVLVQMCACLIELPPAYGDQVDFTSILDVGTTSDTDVDQDIGTEILSEVFSDFVSSPTVLSPIPVDSDIPAFDFGTQVSAAADSFVSVGDNADGAATQAPTPVTFPDFSESLGNLVQFGFKKGSMEIVAATKQNTLASILLTD